MEAKENIQKKVKGVSIRFLITLGIFLIFFLIFLAITDEMVLEHENALDFKVFHFLSAFITPAHTSIMTFITFFGSDYFLLPAYLLLIGYYFFFKRNSHLSWNILAVGVSSTAILFLLKFIFERPRPIDPVINHVNGFSFPSGHTFCGFTFFGILIYIVWHTVHINFLKWLFSFLLFAFAFFIGFSRVYLRVHYASDVVAGFCLSIVYLGLSFWVLQKIKALRINSTVGEV